MNNKKNSSTTKKNTTSKEQNKQSSKNKKQEQKEKSSNKNLSKTSKKVTTNKKTRETQLLPEKKEIRLNKYIANAGICSRRKADELIIAGAIKVNGKIVTKLGTKVKPGDVVEYDGKVISNEKKVYILLNKPKDYITSTFDPKGRKTVMELIKNACKERVFPVGRLDRATTGLLLLTNDGELAKKLMHPRYKVRKVYAVVLDRPLAYEDFKKIEDGVELEDGKAIVDIISYTDEKDKRKLGIEIHMGKNRIIRRIFEHLGYKVVKLDRVVYAGLTKKDLPRGRWRFLTKEEIIKLYMNNFE